MSYKVFLARNASNFERLEGLLREAGYDLLIGPKTTPGVMLEFPADQLDALFGEADAIVTSMREEYTREVLEAAVRARVLVSPLLGVDNIDVDGCTELGLAVGYGAHPQNYLGVAEATAAFIVTLLKRLRGKEHSLRTSGWSGGRPGSMVMGRTIGLVGFGRAGSAVAARLQGWGARFLIADPYADPALVAAAGGELAPLETVLRESDVVSLHAFLAPETRGLIGEAQLGLMKPTAYLINLARGGLVDQPALVRALQEEWIAGAALDVFEVEPLPADSPLREIDSTRLILTPHNAGFSQEGAEAGPLAMLENLKRGLAGEPPLYFLNPNVLPAWRARLARLGVPEPALAAPTSASGQWGDPLQTLDPAQRTDTQDQAAAPLDVSDVLVASMVANGVDTLFFSSGTDLIPYQEAISKARATGRKAPRVITMLHEIVNLNTAIGYTMTSGKPAVTGVHVDAGTLNCGAGYHTILRGNYPVVVTAGSAPTTLPGTMPGARDGYYFWYQELPDQASIVRQFAKWDRKLELQDSPGFIMSRALQVAQTPPAGLSYLSLPREVLMAPARTADFPTVQGLGIPRPIGLDAAQAREIVDLLVEAEKPLVILGRSGRNPKTFRAMVELAELLALPVKNGEGPDAANFPSDHPLMGTGPAIGEADVVLVIESGFPWVQGAAGPHPEATVITIGEEPIQDRIVTYEYPASQRYRADAYAAIVGLREAADGRLAAADRARFAERLSGCEAKKAEQRRRLEENAQKAASSTPISPIWLSYQLGKLANESSILVNDACTNAGQASSYFPIRQPGSYFRSGGSAGGWGLGASLGAKLGAPDREVILTVGEGYYLFGVSNVTFWAAKRYGAPFLAVMYQNDSYSTGTSSIGRLYPDGYAISQREFEGGMLHPAIDYVKEAEAAGAAAERVTDPDEVGPALQRGLEAVRSGLPALVAVQLPRLMCD